MVSFGQARRPAGRPKAEPGRVVALFGAPGAGVTTVAKVLVAASNKMVQVFTSVDDLKLSSIVGDVRIIDCILAPDDVKHLVEEHLVDGANQGKIVHVQNLDVPTTPEWDRTREAIEQTVQLYSLPYFTVQNTKGDLEAAVGELARIAQLRS